MSSHLLAVTPTCDSIEYLDVARSLLEEPVRPKEGKIERDGPGTGIR